MKRRFVPARWVGMDALTARRAPRFSRFRPPSTRLVVFVVALVAAFSASACAFPPLDGKVEVALPEFPAQWAGLWEGGKPAWSLDLLAEGRRIRMGTGLRPGEILTVDGQCGPITVLLALPEGGGDGLTPAGAILPLDARRGPGGLPRVAPDFRGGWLASAAAALLGRDGAAAERFDWARLAAEAAARLEDPWTCAPEGLAERIAEGGFSLWLLKPAPAWPLRLEGDFPSDVWLPASPFALPLEVEGGALAAECAEGLHHYYSARHRLAISVDGKGRAVWGILERDPQADGSEASGPSAGRLRSATISTSMRMTRARM